MSVLNKVRKEVNIFNNKTSYGLFGKNSKKRKYKRRKQKVKKNKMIPLPPFSHNQSTKDIINSEMVHEAEDHLVDSLFNAGSGRGSTGSAITSFFINSLKSLQPSLMTQDNIRRLLDASSRTFRGKIQPKSGVFALSNGELKDISQKLKATARVAESIGDVIVFIGIGTGQPEVATIGGAIIAASNLVKIGDEYLDKYIQIQQDINTVLGDSKKLPTNVDGEDYELNRPDFNKEIDDRQLISGKGKNLFPQSTIGEAISFLDELDELYEELEHPATNFESQSYSKLNELNQSIEHTKLNEAMFV